MDDYREGDDGEGASKAPKKQDAPSIEVFKRWFKKDTKHTADWRKEAKEDFAFEANDQWTKEDRDLLREQQRPPITFNRSTTIIRAITGYEALNRQECRYLPREQGDIAVNDVLTSAAEWFRDQCDAEDEDADAFHDTVVCGMGWTETKLAFDTNPDGEPSIERCDPLEMLWDCGATKRNLTDARRVWRVRKMTLAEARDMFPETDDALLNAKWAREWISEDGDEPNDGDPRNAYMGTDNQSDDDENRRYGAENSVVIVHVQWLEHKTMWRVAEPESGEIVEVSEEEAKKLMKRMPMMGMEFQGVKQRKAVRRQAFLGKRVLEVGDTPSPHQFTYQCITGYRDRNKGTWYGLMRLMKDPQRWANKWLSQSLHIMNSNAKGGVMVEADALGADKNKFLDSWARADAVTEVPMGSLSGPAGSKIQPKPTAGIPPGFYQLMEFAISSVRDVSGVSLEMLGMREGDQPASLEAGRKQTGMAILATLFDSLKRYRKAQGRLLLHYITNHLSDGRLVKIVGKEGEQYLPLLKQADIEYDVIVDDSPSNPNQKEAVWAFLAPLIFKFPPKIMMALMEYSPLPKAIIDKVQKAAAEEAEASSQPGPEVEAKIEAMKARAAKDNAEAQSQGADQGQNQELEMQKMQMQAQMQQMKAQADLQMKQVQLQNEIEIERQKLAAEMQLKQQEMEEKFRLREQEMAFEMQLKQMQMQLGLQMPGIPTNIPRGR